MMRLRYDQDCFFLDDQELRIISGAIHYFRVVPEYWEDRLRKLKNCGFNTVETYMPWNLHEKKQGEFDFSYLLDVERFIQIASSLGLYVILRPGPYICAEWEFGGLPSWLLNIEGLKLRVNNGPFLHCVENYFHEVFKRVKPYLLENGGPIIMMQVENEYGSYGMDHDYMRAIYNLYQKEKMNVFLFTSDGDDLSMLNGGTLKDVFKVVNFGSDATRNFKNLRQFMPSGPLMCGEFWNGWFDHWGEEHHVREADDTAKSLEEILDLGGNVNFYMFHGGTNFNFYNGANHFGVYQPTVTSYDYHCLVSENGDLTDKYYACKDVLKRHGFVTDTLEVSNLPRKSYGTVNLTQGCELFHHLDSFVQSKKEDAQVYTMEAMGQNFGFILYRTTLKGPFQKRPLKIMGLHDRALVFLDGKYAGVMERDQPSDEILIEVDWNQEMVLDILVENMGRVNYGPELYDYKGITKSVLLGLQEIQGWQTMTIPLDSLSTMKYEHKKQYDGPTMYKGTLTIDEVCDTFIYLDNFEKGNVFINGFNIGRYFKRGPQRSLYVPAPLLHEGENTIEVFEIHGTSQAIVELKDVPDLG